MRARILALAALALCSALAGGGIALAVQPTDVVIELLSGTANTPNKNRIDSVMGETAVEDLIAISEDTSVDSDPVLRIRAFAALRHFGLDAKGETVRLALKSSIDLRRTESSGTELLYLRAAMLALAEVGMESSVPDLLELLGHPSRDIRAACAQALGITGSDTAIVPLRDRALIEQEPQVQLAIDDALFELESD